MSDKSFVSSTSNIGFSSLVLFGEKCQFRVESVLQGIEISEGI